MSYNVYLFNGLAISASLNRPTLSAGEISGIYWELKKNFDKVVKAHDAIRGTKVKYGSASIQWLAYFPNVLPHELLIYLLPSGVTLATSGKLQVGRPQAGHDGFTHMLSGSTASEVYYHMNDPIVVANLMFHEAMHNKLNLGNPQLHPLLGLASASVGPETTLSNSNRDQMAAALDIPRPQWTAGIKMLSDASMIPDSDPSKGMW